ncbi:MAG: phage major capsid protein [Nitrococcus mobilis]|nr:phage major capsid protein [Nitrococcus mobilis]
MPNVNEVIEKLDSEWDDFSRRDRAYKSELEERLSKLECDRDMPMRAGPSGQRVTPEQQEHLKAFDAWLRNPTSPNTRGYLEQVQQKAVTEGSDPGGGFAVPEQLSRQILQRMRDLSPIRQVARVVQVSSSDYVELVDIGGTSSGWVGEGDSRSETNTPQLAEVRPTFGIVYSRPQASEEALADIMFDVQGWLVDRCSEELAIAESQAFISGDGTKKPTGFLDASPVSTADDGSPARSFGVLQYIPTGVSDGFGTLSTSSPEHYPADVLWQTVYALRAGYRSGAVWLMNSSTAGVIRRFKDADGRYIWQDSLIEGQPSMLCGHRVQLAEHMPDIGANAHPVAFGNFRRGYTIADSFGLRITVDSNITEPGQTKFYIRKRVGGITRDDHAAKVIKVALS